MKQKKIYIQVWWISKNKNIEQTLVDMTGTVCPDICINEVLQIESKKILSEIEKVIPKIEELYRK